MDIDEKSLVFPIEGLKNDGQGLAVQIQLYSDEKISRDVESEVSFATSSEDDQRTFDIANSEYSKTFYTKRQFEGRILVIMYEKGRE